MNPEIKAVKHSKRAKKNVRLINPTLTGVRDCVDCEIETDDYADTISFTLADIERMLKTLPVDVLFHLMVNVLKELPQATINKITQRFTV